MQHERRLDACRPGVRDLLCRICGSVTDAPRSRPETGLRQRKCPVCLGWQDEWSLGGNAVVAAATGTA